MIKRNQKISGKNNAVASNLTSEILRLDMDCFGRIFDYLPLEDLLNIAQTCHRLQQEAGFYFRGIWRCTEIPIGCTSKLNKLAKFHDKIQAKNQENFAYIMNNRLSFTSMKQIEFCYIKLSKHSIESIGELLINVETIKMVECEIYANFHKIILTFCPNLKRLHIDLCEFGNDWLLQNYPKLEYFFFNPPPKSKSLNHIIEFLKLNPNIRQFATESMCLMENKELMKCTKIKLDDLAVLVTNQEIIRQLHRLLYSLQQRRIFKRLKIYINGLDQASTDQLSVLDSLVKLHATSIYDRVTLSILKNLEDVYIRNTNDINDLKSFSKNLIKLKRIHFETASFDNIMPFIKRAKNLLIINVTHLEKGQHFSKRTQTIDLFALNRARKQLTDAQKVTLYVKEKIFLATKWAMGMTDLDLISIKREESYEADEDFDLSIDSYEFFRRIQK